MIFWAIGANTWKEIELPVIINKSKHVSLSGLLGNPGSKAKRMKVYIADAEKIKQMFLKDMYLYFKKSMHLDMMIKAQCTWVLNLAISILHKSQVPSFQSTFLELQEHI